MYLYLLFFSFGLMYHCLNGAIPSRKYSIKAPSSSNSDQEHTSFWYAVHPHSHCTYTYNLFFILKKKISISGQENCAVNCAGADFFEFWVQSAQCACGPHSRTVRVPLIASPKGIYVLTPNEEMAHPTHEMLTWYLSSFSMKNSIDAYSVGFFLYSVDLFCNKYRIKENWIL